MHIKMQEKDGYSFKVYYFIGRALMSPMTLKEIAANWKSGGLCIQGLLDRMLIALWDALFLTMAEEWSRRGVANLNADETPELARWFLRGQAFCNPSINDLLLVLMLLSFPIKASLRKSDLQP